MELTTVRECASRWQVSEPHARRILAAVEPVDRDTTTGAKRYDLAEAEAAYSSRPGPGARTDLTTAAVSPEQFEKLIADKDIPAAHRALWSLLWEGGLKVGDVLSLDVRDVDPEAHTVAVDSPSHSADGRLVPLSDATAALTREAVAGRDAGPLIFDGQRPLSRELASRAAQEIAHHNIHAFRAGGQMARPHKLEHLPRVSYEAADEAPDSREAGAGVCQCPCVHLHASQPDVCTRAGERHLLVDVTRLSPETGEVIDRRLRRFCAECFMTLPEQMAGQADRRRAH
ncbi:Phage integrase family protein [Actinacidiphila alni]|uniref:Phage integrase family protein n=1 Tax=Actinacidiphila alni TaxID=380248 RepID=A0A1I2MH37_9ACTN|nr:site-specific integrase [Actinacidiphila alni]SFF90804.1 Phage integrase family protein [Actinacidiphila alni]